MSLRTSLIKIPTLISIYLCTIGATNTIDINTKQSLLEAELDYLIGQGVCDSDSQCGSIAYGEKACGGPEGYKLYSSLTSDRAMLLALSTQYTELSHEKNIQTENWGDCSVVEPVVAVCNNVCVSLH